MEASLGIYHGDTEYTEILSVTFFMLRVLRASVVIRGWRFSPGCLGGDWRLDPGRGCSIGVEGLGWVGLWKGMEAIHIIRHWKERRSKCSLTPLEGRGDLVFHRARAGWTFEAGGFTVLGLDAPLLTEADAGRPLLLLDCTWRLLPDLEACLVGEPVRRTLPAVQTAYPRVSKLKPDPLGGLASVEALYLARLLLGDGDAGLLEAYHWRDDFLKNVSAAGY